MREFLSKSTEVGVYLKGGFDMPRQDLYILYDFWERTGMNLLNLYAEYVYDKADALSDNESEISTLDYYPKLTAIEYLKEAGIQFNDAELSVVLRYLKSCHDRYKRSISRTYKRVEASTHTSNQTIRKKVFGEHGKQCLCCGSTENIEIDHIIPVALGGINDISNYQPLCRSCNAKKGTDIIDYRTQNTK